MIPIFIYLYLSAMKETGHSVSIKGGRAATASSPIALAVLFTLELLLEYQSRGDRQFVVRYQQKVEEIVFLNKGGTANSRPLWMGDFSFLRGVYDARSVTSVTRGSI